MRILVTYATSHGSTAEVAEFIGEKLRAKGYEVSVEDAALVMSIDIFDAFVIGSAIHSGEWLPEGVAFLEEFGDEISEKPAFCFVTCIRVLEDKGYDWVLNNYMPPWLLEKLNLLDVTAFAGKLEFEEVSWEEEWTLALKYDGSYPAIEYDGDFREWNEIEAWANLIARILKEYKKSK
jgi:menaquinone-dependent protoporphyrinogen oxidase